jgi:hypothetical protein
MSPVHGVSDQEVSCAIRYLDPDHQDGPEIAELRGAKPQSSRQLKAAFVIASLCATLYFTAHRYLPAVIRLFN